MMMPPKGNILYVLALDRRFSTFASLMKKSGIADSLQTAGPFTVFVPNNEVKLIDVFALYVMLYTLWHT